MDNVDRIIECIQKVGIDVSDSEDYKSINLNEYVLDSISFVSFIVEVEKEFDCEIPDDLLLMSTLTTVGKFSEMIDEIKQNNIEKKEQE